MQLENLGYNDFFERFRQENHLTTFETGRVIAEHKERYVVMTSGGEFDAEITGSLRFTAKGREDFPAVGDWVALTLYYSGFAVIHQVFPRFSVIKRQAVGRFGEVQLIATNIDYAFIVQAVDRDFNLNRFERYLTLCYASQVSPVIVLSKIDLISGQQLNEVMEIVNSRIKSVPVIALSNQSQEGYQTIQSLLEKGKTYCLLGSSGVGKSSLLNNLSGATLMRTDGISIASNRGKHVTTHRELIVLENGSLLIDNPGMREVGVTDSVDGLELTFSKIVEFSHFCRFKDCTHIHETGCAVIEAVEKGTIDRASYENYLKIEREKAHFESSVAERRKKDKEFGKMLKNYKKQSSGDKG
jgi:ribosome biogenesis GTPase